MSKIIFNIVAKDIQKPHVTKYVRPAGVEKHRGEKGKHDLPESVCPGALQKCNEVGGHHSKLSRRDIRQVRVLRHLQPLQQKNKDIQPNQEAIDVGRAVARLVVFDGKHGAIW